MFHYLGPENFLMKIQCNITIELMFADDDGDG